MIFVAIAACSPEPPARSAAQVDVIAYRELLDNAVGVTTHYRAVMMDPGMTAGMCLHVHGNYDSAMRWYLGQMSNLSPDMDGDMATHDGGEVADVECVTTAMMNELDQHASVACSWGDLASDRSEANRDVDAMLALTTHATQRCDEMQSGLDGNGWSWTPMMPVCRL